MTQEEKELLLKDLCGRLPYGLKVCYINLSDEMPKVWDLIGMPALHLADILVEGSCRFAGVNIEKSIRPYLRPMSSMTEEEQFQLGRLLGATSYNLLKGEYSSLKELLEYVYKNHIDLFGLIPKGLALEAPEGMYVIK